jgi:gamma-glutamylcyclotransferase (GGCT)/AIG2-like uncharacterized protein YtfP
VHVFVYGTLLSGEPNHHRLLRALDRFEDVPTLYRRVPIRLIGGSVVHGYALARPGVKQHRLIPGGDWREYRRGPPR